MYNFFTDGSHGWLEVPAIKLIEYGIAGEISHCSYMRGPSVYLEEDCDAPIFMRAYCKALDVSEHEFILNTQYVYQDGPSPIRSYNNYRPTIAVRGVVAFQAVLFYE